MDDEVQTLRLARAITMAFRVERKPVDDDGEEVIDTTKPEFVKHFQGFTNIPGAARPAQQRFQHTDVRMG